MKKINLLVCTLAFAGLGFTSCSDDDNENNNDSTRIEGVYNLDEVNTAAQTDFDMNGDSHIDQMEESKCYDGGKLELRADDTFTYVVTDILIGTDGQAGCSNSATYTGIYTKQAATDPSNALITITYSNSNGATVSRTFTKIGNELTYNDNTIISTYPDRNSEGGAVMVNGSREYVYEK